MDPRSRAEQVLAHARARGAFVVTPENATSPMDAASTVRLTKETITAALTGEDPEPTNPDWPSAFETAHSRNYPQTPSSHEATRPNFGGAALPKFWPQDDADAQTYAGTTEWPQQDYAQKDSGAPRWPRRAPGEFGPLGSQAFRNS